MTEKRPVGLPGPHLDDERFSALLDGLAEPSDAAHVDGCPECAARLVGWRKARDLVATAPVVASESRRQAAVEAALAAFDGSERTSVTGVDDLAAVRRRRRVGVGWGRGAAAAAAVVLVAGLAFGLSRTIHDHAAVKTAGRSEAGASTTPKAASNPPAGASGSSAAATPGVFGGSTSASAAQGSLGRVSDMAALIQKLRVTTGAKPSALHSSTKTSSGPCRPPSTAGVAATTSPEEVATLEYAGTRAEVFVFELSHSHIVVVVSASSCGILAQGAF